MDRNNRKCVCCGKEYRYCGNCGEDYMQPTWKAILCCENCYEIFMTATNYANHTTNALAAKERLSKCDFSYKDKFTPGVVTVLERLKNDLDEIGKIAAARQAEKDKEAEIARQAEEREKAEKPNQFKQDNQFKQNGQYKQERQFSQPNNARQFNQASRKHDGKTSFNKKKDRNG